MEDFLQAPVTFRSKPWWTRMKTQADLDKDEKKLLKLI